MSIERISLNGDDWEAQYFISDKQYFTWAGRSRNIENMLLDSAVSSGFISGAATPGALKGKIPGCDRSFLLSNGIIEEPFFGRNLGHSNWSEQAAWAFRKQFVIPEAWRGRRIIIHFSGIDYEASFFFNGVLIETHQGAFIPVTLDITDFVKFGETNLIALSFEPAPQGSPNHQDNAPADFAFYHRTQIGFGWDWSRKFVPTGIWDDVTLISYDMARLDQWNISARETKVTLDLDILSRASCAAFPIQVTLALPGSKVAGIQLSKQVALQQGANKIAISFDVPGLIHWLPNGMGKPALYGLEVKFDGETVLQKQVGFKDMAVRLNPDAPENAVPLLFTFSGTPVFINGVDWVPPHLMASETTAEDYELLVQLAANAGINLFRMWGGGQLEKEAFYDACDRHGIMVWHEFYHACSNSPKNDDAYVAFKEREARSVLMRLRHHVSLSMICGGNEMQSYGEIPDAPVLKIYRRLAEELVPALPFNVSSPDNSRPGERYHGPWNFLEHSFYNTHFRYLASEYGCNAMMPFESLKRFVPASELECRESQVLQYHFFSPGRMRPAKSFDAQLAKFQPAGMKQFCDATMFAQADVTQYMTEHYRRLFPKSSGCIFWQYNEPWPTCGWSIVDFYGCPKEALYGIKRAGQPVLLSLEDNSWCLKDGRLKAEWFCTVAFPAASGKKVSATLEIWTAAGKKILGKKATVKLTEGTQKLMNIDEALPEGEIIVVRMAIPGITTNTRLYGNPDFSSFFSYPPNVLLKKQKSGLYQITNKSTRCALSIRLEELKGTPKKRGFFDDDYLTLLPGETQEVRFIEITK